MQCLNITLDNTVASQRKQERNQGLVNDILMPKIIMEKRLLRAHQEHHRSSIIRPKIDAQCGFKRRLFITFNILSRGDDSSHSKSFSS
ncbi:unnamed protein product [Spirodela intermedia]|uniref:Uncharacterized protein n=1 Tax=Spirodela intermedia TaxID=51605 RepID=A0A7I8KSZ6_SPIIN|nr:unnamed protein product [Spirodela intermedia]